MNFCVSGRMNRIIRMKATTSAFMLTSVALFAGLLASAVNVARGADWPQWRGPGGQGHATEARDLPQKWSEQENVKWKTPLPGRGWSSPAIAGGKIWLTSAIETPLTEEEKKKRLAKSDPSQPLTVSGPVNFRAICVDQATGKLLHDIDLMTEPEPDPIHPLNSFASPSPILDDGKLYCHFGTNGTACVDVATGRVLWTNREMRLKHENGPGSTPIIWKDYLVFHCDGSDVQYIAALDKRTGRMAWKTDRTGKLNPNPQLKKAYGTPVVLTLDGTEVLLSTGADWLYGYDPATGKELWKMNYGVLGFSIVPRPVAAHGMLYFSTSFMQPELLAVKLAGPATTPEIAWRAKKGAPNMPSPIVVGDELYMVSDKGIVTCFDAVSGKQHYSERLGGNFCSSPLLADGRIYVGNREGQTFVIKPGKTFELLATNTLDGQIMASPAALDRALYVRTDKAMYRIEK